MFELSPLTLHPTADGLQSFSEFGLAQVEPACGEDHPTRGPRKDYISVGLVAGHQVPSAACTHISGQALAVPVDPPIKSGVQQ